MSIKSVFLTFFCFLIPTHAFAEQIQLKVVQYPPLAYEKAGNLKGVAPEVVAKIQAMVQDTSTQEITPWLRAFKDTQSQPMHALFAIVRIPERENLFKWVGPIFGEGDYFFKRKGNPLAIKTLDDAKKVKRIAVRKDGYTHQTLAAAGFTNLDVGPSYSTSFKKLAEGRVDLVLMGEKTYYYMVKKAGVDPDSFERTTCKFADSTAWIAFSLDVPNATIQKWQTALDQLKNNGTYDEIMDRNFKH